MIPAAFAQIYGKAHRAAYGRFRFLAWCRKDSPWLTEEDLANAWDTAMWADFEMDEFLVWLRHKRNT